MLVGFSITMTNITNLIGFVVVGICVVQSQNKLYQNELVKGITIHSHVHRHYKMKYA